MEYEVFIKKCDEIEKCSIEKQKAFYKQILENETSETPIRLMAYFKYACVYYDDGDFRKASEILEPFIISYQNYAYQKEMVSCFNFMGVCSQCEGEYKLARHYYNLAFKLVKEHNENCYLTYEYNNISLTYIFEENYPLALQYILQAEKYLPLSDQQIGAFVYLNKCDIYSHLNQLEKAEEVFRYAIQEQHCLEVLPYDTLIVGVSLFHRKNDWKQYSDYVSKILSSLDEMHPSEYIDACKTVFKCALSSEQYDTIELLITKMNAYMSLHPNENKVGLGFEQLKYEYAKKVGNTSIALKALEEKGKYYEKIVTIMEEKRITSMDEYIEIQDHLHIAVENEKKANQAKTTFLTNMSHDIRTPMNAIIGYTQLMRKELHTPKLLHYQDMIDKSCHLLLSIINNVLDMSRIESGKAHVEENYDKAGSILNEVCGVFGAEAKEKGITFEQHYHVQHTNILCDTTKIEQMYANIISNAIKYTPSGGKISITLTELPCQEENHVTLKAEIEDTGIGMSKDFLPKLFNSFSRERDTTSSKIPGTGLGMAIVKGIVDLMNGTIEVESELGKGTKFTIILTHPLADNNFIPAASLSEEKEVIDFSGKRVLLVEDNEMNAEIAIEILKGFDFTVDYVEDGMQCIHKLEQEESDTYDFIFMDIQMPNMDGYEATRIIRHMEDKKKAFIPIIAMTANAFETDRKKAFESGMNGHISKPISPEKIIEVVTEILQ